MVDWVGKLTSRKFWTAVSAFVTGLIIAFGGTQETATQVAALIMSGAAVVAYIIGEGMADAAGAAHNIAVDDDKLDRVEHVTDTLKRLDDEDDLK